MDFTLYWFMFPVAIVVSVLAMLSGIGGTAIFTPFFILVFPFLGEQYLLQSPLEAMAAALMTTTCGFSSGFIGYYRKGLIDFQMTPSFLKVSIPAAILGVISVQFIPAKWVITFYGLLMIAVALFLQYGARLFHDKDPDSGKGMLKTKTGRSGRKYTYVPYTSQASATGLGGYITGLMSVGIGELVMPQFLIKGKIPMEIAAGTSIFITLCTVFTAASSHVYALVQGDGWEAVPWHLVCYTVPGVILGGQIGPGLQGRFPQKNVIRAMTGLFFCIGIAMIISALRSP